MMVQRMSLRRDVVHVAPLASVEVDNLTPRRACGKAGPLAAAVQADYPDTGLIMIKQGFSGPQRASVSSSASKPTPS
jgi:hypothetical protein